MNLTIGSTTIEITSYARKRDLQKGFYLELVIPKESIGMDDLYNLLDGNTEAIVITDNAGVENTYLGFKEIGSFACENGFYKVAQVCTSEIEAQLSLAQNKVAEQNVVIANMQSVIGTQAVALQSHAEIITEQQTALADQTAAIEAQTETIEAQTAELELLNDTLLELLMA